MVSGEHFVLRDLPFYEEAREADAKARQERLEQREEKRQEEKLRRAPGEMGRVSPSVAHPPTEKKKKTIVKAIKVATPTPESSSTSTASASSP